MDQNHKIAGRAAALYGDVADVERLAGSLKSLLNNCFVQFGIILEHILVPLHASFEVFYKYERGRYFLFVRLRI